MKPDLVAFGGCEHNADAPALFNAGDARGSSGTSFASPLVASIGAQAVGTVERGTALLARTLLIHTAKQPPPPPPQIDPDFLLGHGLVQTSLDGLIRCNAREVTVVFQGDISATDTCVFHHAATRPRGKWQREDILDSWGASAGESEPSVRLHLHVRRRHFLSERPSL